MYDTSGFYRPPPALFSTGDRITICYQFVKGGTKGVKRCQESRKMILPFLFPFFFFSFFFFLFFFFFFLSSTHSRGREESVKRNRSSGRVTVRTREACSFVPKVCYESSSTSYSPSLQKKKKEGNPPSANFYARKLSSRDNILGQMSTRGH